MKTLITVFCLLPLLAFFGNNSTKDHSSQNYNISEKTILNCPEPPSFYEFIDQGKSKSVSQDEIDQDWYSQTLEKIEAEEYSITYNEKLGAYQSPNRANNIRFIYHNDGFTATTRSDAEDWSIRFGITNYDLRVKNGDFRVDGNKAFIGNEKIRIDYANTKEGMRQDFIIKEKPVGIHPFGKGNGRLRLNMSVDTKLKMIVGSDALMFKDNYGNEKMKYSQLKCWDAEGKELRAYFEKNSTSPNSTFNSGFSIVVNDDNATYPITIDPLSTSPDWTSEGDQAYADFGVWVSTAGDVNGDGYSEVIVGANLYDNGQTDEGIAYLYYGSGTGLSLSPGWVNEGNQDYCNYGIGVGTAGDVNGDGYSDVIVGADLYDNGQTNEGRAYVYYGSSTGLSMTPNWTAENNQAESIFGYRVATAGDINGDGYSDVLINAVGYDNGETNEGRVYAYLGSATGLSANPVWIAESNQSDSEFGISLSSAGDVNGDGYSDVLVGANSYDNGETNEGMIYVYQGSSSGLPASPSWTFESNMANAYLGWRASSAGDVNGDGYSDITAGAPFYNGYGRVYTFYGSALGLPATANWIVDSDLSDSEFGGAVSTAGDVNGDGFSDLIIGACLYDNPENKEGRAFLYLGSPSGLSSSPSWMIESNQAGAEFGVSVSTAGDVNGDGFSDVIVGSFYFNGGQVHEGKAFVYHGSPSGLSVPVSWTEDGDQSAGQFGISVSTAGDVNGDGYSDVIIGANCYDNGETDEGRAYVYLGSSAGLLTSPSWFAESNQAFSYYGSRVSTAGDVNGDGYSDVMASAIKFDNGENDEGKVYLYYGSSSGLSATPNWTSESNNENAWFGYQLKTAGDVNGDGYSDVIIGAEQFSNGETGEGKAFVYYGSASGLSQQPNWTYEGNQALGSLGYGVSSAGDVNGDGYSDVLVSAYAYDNGQSDEGIVYLFYGSSTGLSVNPNWSAEGNQVTAYFGYAVSNAGDVNGDGYDDVIIGAWCYSNGEYREGRAFVYHGSAIGLSSNPNWTAESNQTESYFGTSASTAGDVNGDGYSDVIVGAPHFENGTWREGRAFVYHGSPAGLSSSPSWTGESDWTFAIYGFTVASAGDVNGDGYSDVIVGAHYYNGNTGKVYVYYGNESGGLRANVRQYKYSTNENISAGGLTGSSGNVRLNMFGKSTFGRTKGKFVFEYKRNGVPFSGNLITNSTAYSGIGSLTNLGTTGTELNQYITGLSISGEYKWRARVQYDPVSNPYQKYSPWKYFYNYAPVPSGGFKARFIPPQTKNLTLFAVIQGFYDPVTDQMARDTVTVYLRQFTAPYQIIDSAKMYLGANGSATYTFNNPAIINNTQYYIQVKHRNSIETWNKGSVFTNSVQSFSFRNFGSAYGNNQILVDDNPLTYAVYSGDVDQDGTVDAADVSLIDNAALLFTSGYVKTDLTGDGFVDATDFAIADNNTANFVSMIRP
jgi:hypothetical protein